MIVAFLCLVGAMIASIALMTWAAKRDSAIVAIPSMLLCMISGCAMLVYGLIAFDWIASEHRALIINREYGTNYTREEVFYASSVIDTVRELDRKRIELDGDLINGDGK